MLVGDQFNVPIGTYLRPESGNLFMNTKFPWKCSDEGDIRGG